MMGPEIRAARKAAGLTQAEFANALGMNRATISKYENGIIEPSVAQLKKMSDILSVQWYLLVPPETKEAYINADTFGLTLESYKSLTMFGERKALLKNRNTGKWMDIKVHIDGSIEASPHYIPPRDRISDAFYQLNKRGQEKAADMVEMIAGNPEYQRAKSPDWDEDDEYEEEQETTDEIPDDN